MAQVRPLMRMWLLWIMMSISSLVAAAPDDETPLRIGVLAFRGAERALQEWAPHAEFLSTRLAPRRFEIVPLALDDFRPAIAEKRIDFVLTATGHYVELEADGNVSLIATRQIRGPNGPLARFGGAVLVRAERTDLTSYASLRGKRILIPDFGGFGGWQVHLREARAENVDLKREVATIIEVPNQDKVVQGVLAGETDAGFVRSDLIESLAAAGKLDLKKIKVIASRQTVNYPYLHSTRLYPEWPLAAVAHIPPELTRDILIALLSMSPEHPAAQAAAIHGWTLPQNYQSVHDLFLETRLGPYANLPVTFSDVMDRYGKPTLATGIVVIVLLGLALWQVTASKKRLQRNESRLRLAASVFEHAQEGILITDKNGDIIDANDTFLALTGHTREEVTGKNPRIFSSGQQDGEFYRAMWHELSERGTWRGELWNRRKDGNAYAQQTSISAVRDLTGDISHYVGLSYDITAYKESQAELEHMAYYDALTGLPNRSLLADRLRLALAQTQRGERLLAVCYLDLDGFKPINDTWGHAAGDRLLIEAANRLLIAVRGGDTVCRLGGDEFVVLIGNLQHFDECEAAVERILLALATPFDFPEGSANISASIGVTLYPLDNSDPDTLIRHADQAMYSAKQAGRNCYTLFDAEHTRISEARLQSQDDIRKAISENQFCLHVQPKVSMRSGRVLGAEGLLRWNHPQRGFLHPAEFLPVIDFVDMQAEVGDWVLEAGLVLLSEWQSRHIDLELSINIAAEQLQRTGFVSRLSEALQRHPEVNPRRLELEILETAKLHDLTEVAEVVRAARDLGVYFAIDDFGTGYSSLSWLKHLKVRTLKIDQSFVRDMLEDPDDLSIVDGVAGLALAFGRQVVAEGVETVAHGRLLLQLGCDRAQGYGIARPMPPEKLPEWAANWKQPAEWQDVSPWPREDLPLLTVEIDHQRWITQFFQAIAAAPREIEAPELDSHACRFGRWLKGDGQARYGHHSAFVALVPIHDAVHRAGRTLIELHHNDPDSARQRLPELHQLRDELIDALHELRQMALGRVD